jgi:hypothetical protein
MLVDPPALHSRLSLPAGYSTLVEAEGRHDSLYWTAVGQQGNHRDYQPPWFVHPVEGSVFCLGEGSPTALATITALFLRVDDDVALAETTVGATAGVVTPLLVRVHANIPLVWESNTKQGCRRTRI